MYSKSRIWKYILYNDFIFKIENLVKYINNNDDFNIVLLYDKYNGLGVRYILSNREMLLNIKKYDLNIGHGIYFNHILDISCLINKLNLNDDIIYLLINNIIVQLNVIPYIEKLNSIIAGYKLFLSHCYDS